MNLLKGKKWGKKRKSIRAITLFTNVNWWLILQPAKEVCWRKDSFWAQLPQCVFACWCQIPAAAALSCRGATSVKAQMLLQQQYVLDTQEVLDKSVKRVTEMPESQEDPSSSTRSFENETCEPCQASCPF